MIFLSDDFLAMSPAPQGKATEWDLTVGVRRFFAIAVKLPMDLQMVLCNRIFGSGKDIVLTKSSEPGFRKLATGQPLME